MKREMMRRLRMLEKKFREEQKIEFWVVMDDGNIRNLTTGEVRSRGDSSEEGRSVKFYISESDAFL